VLIELDGEGVDLALELGQAAGQPVTLLAKGFGQRDHRLDEPTLAILDGWDGVHLVTSAHAFAAWTQTRCRSGRRRGRALGGDAVSPA
jgi:hypothetical protein